jgi:ribonuclease P protein component
VPGGESASPLSRASGNKTLRETCTFVLQVVNDVPKPPAGRFPKSSHLRKHADFQAVYKEGRKRFAGNVTVFYRERNDQAGPRVGFTVGKVLGGAVERNRIRRRLRAVTQRRLSQLIGPVDVVMHPRKSVLNLGFAKLDLEVQQLFAAIQKGRAR